MLRLYDDPVAIIFSVFVLVVFVAFGLLSYDTLISLLRGKWFD